MHISTLTLSDAAGVETINADTDKANVNVYSLQGILLRSNVAKADALNDLPSGIYIVGDKKVKK
jgi:hypothetical protein